MSKVILLIEDNAVIRESTAELLKLADYTVLEAKNGKFGVDMAFQHKPDLILCDIMMPELDGYGVLYLLSKNPETTSIPFIFLTARSERTDFRKGMELGADDYLSKPFFEKDLLNAVEKRLSKSEIHKAYNSKGMKSLEGLATDAENGNTELKALINKSKIRQIRKKQVLYYVGDQPAGIYLVLEGCIKTIKLAADGRELITGLYHTDEYLGVSSLLLDELFNESAEATENSAVCMLPQGALISLLNQFPDIAKRFIRILSNNVREKEDQLLDLAYHSVRKRLAQVLVRLSKPITGNTAQFSISREELAALAGVASETVSRTLTDFKEEGLIEKKSNQMEILNLNGLIKIKN